MRKLCLLAAFAFGRATFVASVALALRYDVSCIAPIVRAERSIEIDLISREVSFVVSTDVTLVSRMRLNLFAWPLRLAGSHEFASWVIRLSIVRCQTNRNSGQRAR
jgi:hypothetical protein